MSKQATKANFFIKITIDTKEQKLTASTTTIWGKNEVVQKYEIVDMEDKDFWEIWKEIGEMAVKPIEESPDAGNFGS